MYSLCGVTMTMHMAAIHLRFAAHPFRVESSHLSRSIQIPSQIYVNLDWATAYDALFGTNEIKAAEP